MKPDPIQTEAEAALKRIALACRSSIDDVLDIMAKLPQRKQPGACLICFFSLHRKLPPHCQADLTQVKLWLEKEIEVVATDSAANVLESFPCRIEERELEDYCHRIMAETKMLLRPGMSKLVLQFRFCSGANEQSA